jgi:hypothetical protein
MADVAMEIKGKAAGGRAAAAHLVGCCGLCVVCCVLCCVMEIESNGGKQKHVSFLMSPGTVGFRKKGHCRPST